MGRKIKIAGDRTFEDWETTIINDEKMNVPESIHNHFRDVSVPPGHQKT